MSVCMCVSDDVRNGCVCVCMCVSDDVRNGHSCFYSHVCMCGMLACLCM